jgi:hypothetical protein
MVGLVALLAANGITEHALTNITVLTRREKSTAAGHSR